MEGRVWTLSYGQSNAVLQGKTLVDEDYFDEIKPMLLILKLLGRLPCDFSKEGLKDCKWFNTIAMYSLACYGLQFYFSVTSMISAYRWQKTAGESSFCVNMSVSYLHNIAVPISFWAEKRNLGVYITLWHDFKDQYYLTTKRKWRPHYHRFTQLSSILNLPLFLVIVILYKMFVYDLPFRDYAMLLPMAGASFSTFSIWCVTCWEIRILSMEILSKIMQKNTGSKEAGDLRRLWLKLARLAKELGNTFAGSHLFFSMTLYVTFTAGLFGIIAEFYQTAEGHSPFAGLASAELISLVLWFSFCEQMYRTSDTVGSEFSEKLLKLDFSRRHPNYRKEVCLILNFIELNTPSIEMKGFFKADRHLIAAYIKSSLQYLMLLLQSVSLTKEATTSYNTTQM